MRDVGWAQHPQELLILLPGPEDRGIDELKWQQTELISMGTEILRYYYRVCNNRYGCNNSDG